MNKFFTMIGMTSLLASPALGSVRDAAFASSADSTAAQTSIFVGATYRVELGKRTVETPGRASLAFTGITRTPTNDIKFRQGLELSQGETGKASLYIAGQNIGEIERKANLSSGAAIAIGVGVILVAGVIVLATYCDNDCENAKGE
jgi:hypothetical protein